MKQRFAMAAGIAILAVVVAVPFLYAQPAHPHGGPGGGGFGFLFGRLDKIKQALNLTDDQVAQLQAIATDLKAQNDPYHEQLRAGVQQITTTLLNNPNDVAAAQALLNQQTAAETAMKTNMLTAASKALNVLTADQRAKVAQFLANRAARNEHP
jgi:Spy/CpxP family protein refolding chaperone